MKKNLKIVSAAAAALLAVAPVAASAVAVNAEPNTEIDFGGGSTNIPAVNSDVTISSDIGGVTTPYETITYHNGRTKEMHFHGRVSGTITATFNGQSFKANLDANQNGASIWEGSNPNVAYSAAHKNGMRPVPASDLIKNDDGTYGFKPGKLYWVYVPGANFNFGSANANRTGNKALTVAGSSTAWVRKSASDAWTKNTTVETDQNGVAKLDVYVPFKVVNTSDSRSVNFYDKTSGENVTGGNISMRAVNGQLNVYNVLSEFKKNYGIHQAKYGDHYAHGASITTQVSDIISDLKKQGISVDGNGNFTAPKSFTFDVSGVANDNQAKTSMTVTVNVPNGKESTNPSEYDHTVRVWNKKESYIYNSNHQRLANGMRYKIGSGHNVVAENGAPKVYHVGGIDAYKLADGHYKGNYVDVRNFSTSRVNSNVKVVTTRARVFSASGRVIGRHNYVNAGVRVRVRGTKTIRGHKMYRIATNRYIKAANVRQA